MNPLTRWLNRRAVRRATRFDDRWMAAEQLWAEGRFVEYADELAVIAQGYLSEPRVVDGPGSAISARMRRCEALVRAGQPSLAETEAARLVAELVDLEGPDGPRQRRLRARMDAAYRGEELAHD
ncbi:hypothetical protein GCM10027290_66670 [Micromonospora sonneratiae]|uniref:DUF222 domain-containing protein n=1 Tax=Micromonospora sonneratiae TaxID=1184706 RepID=A0ABW3YLZ5_9ACTN